jgi:hypothetical protein
MPVLNLTVRHGRTLEDARRGLEQTVQRVSGQFGPLVRQVEWARDRDRVKLHGAGFWVEIGWTPKKFMRRATSRCSRDCSEVVSARG